jgi:predicted DCC family thiol-disulfide oxidoreductase YuxK
MSVVADSSNLIVLYDGVCGLCNGLVQFVLERDAGDRFRFAALQSGFAHSLLQKHGVDPQPLESLRLLLDYGQPTERVLERSAACIRIFRELGPFWRTLGNLIALLPLGFRDWGYDLVARHRYRIFGKYEACPLPSEKDRQKFLGLN